MNDFFNFSHRHYKWYFLTFSILCYLLSGPVLHIGVAAWFIPIGILFFTRNSHPLKGYLWAVLFMMIISVIGSSLTSPLPFIAILIAAPIAAFPELLPYLIDRLFHKKLNSSIGLFLFPAVAVLLEYLLSFVFSSIGVLAATQSNSTEFIQLASVTGVWGVSFVMYWTASVITHTLIKNEYKPLRPLIAVLILIFLFGYARTKMDKEVKDTVRVSGIAVEENDIWEAVYRDVTGKEFDVNIETAGSSEMGIVLEAFQELFQDPENEKFENTRNVVKEFGQRLIRLTELEAQAGSKIIVWSETNLPIFQKDEGSYIEGLQKLAQEKKIYLSASMAVLLPYVEGGPMYENKAVLINDAGEIVDEFHKAKPVPFMDASEPGDGIIKAVDSQYGKLSQAICYDADFPKLMHQSAKADILILPANDWLGISPYHGDYSAFRAIENGVSIIRPTGSGESVIFNQYGEALNRVGAFDKEDRIVQAYVPVKGVATIYSFIGDTIIWLCGLYIGWIFIIQIIRYRK